MKRLLPKWLLLFTVILGFACTKEPAIGDMNQQPTPEETGHRVPIAQALSELESVLVAIDQNGSGQTRSGGPRSVASITTIHGKDLFSATRSAEVPDVEELVYIANFEGDQGYAILAADDRLSPVIAITDQGSLTAEQFTDIANGNYDITGKNPPPVFGDAVAYVMRVGIDPGNGIVPPGGGTIIKPPFPPAPPTLETYTYYSPWTVTSRIGPFMPMRWGQWIPFNKYAYDVYGQLSYAGCVAEAVSQIIASNRYRFERNGYPIWEYGGHTIDWRVIFEKFDSYLHLPTETSRTFKRNDTSPAADMIARFIRGIGDRVATSYAPDGSSAYVHDVRNFLDYLGYGDVKTWTYSATYVDRMVRERNLPIYVRGQCGEDGHAWIIDGILYQKRTVETRLKGTGVTLNSQTESRALFHCNFGWSGEADGYYLIDMFADPKSGATVTENGDTVPDNPNANHLTCYTSNKKCLTYTTAW